MLRYTNMCINHLKTQTTTLLSNGTNLMTQQTRNTYILKRRYPVPLNKKNQKPQPLKSKYFVYDLIENTVARKEEKIDLILLESVEGVGLKGQKVSVNSKKAYYEFLLPKLAVYDTPENVKKYLIEDAEKKKLLNIKSSKFVDRTLNILSRLYLCVSMSMHVPWTIEKWHIRATFRKAGFIVPEEAITLPERPISGPDLSIEAKEFYITVKINNIEETKVRCKILHFTLDPKEKIPKGGAIWALPSVAIYPEDQPIIDLLPKHGLLCNQATNDISK